MYNWIKRRLVAVSVLLYLLCFFLTRLPYYLNYDIPGFCRDTFGYYYPVIALLKGSMPVFDLRTPAYPLFLYGCEIAHLTTFQIFVTQSLLGLAALIFCQYLINKHLTFLNLPFLLFGLIFYSSGKSLFYDTYINPTGLFTWTILLVTFLLPVAVTTKKPVHFFLLSLFFAIAVLLRPQSFFLIPVIGGVCIYNLLKKNHRQNLAFLTPLLSVIILFLAYNKMTFGSFSFSKFQALPDIGSAIFFLDDSGNYSEQTKAIIDSVNRSFSPEERKIIRTSCSYSRLSQVFTVDNYNKFFLFWEVYQNNPDELKMLARNSRIINFRQYCKFIMVNFINYFKVTASDFFFYYTELNRRKATIEIGDHFTFFKDSEDTFRMIFHEYADPILQKRKLDKTGILTSEDYMTNFNKERLMVKINHFYQVLFNKIMYNYAWVFLFWIAFIISAAFILLKKHDLRLLMLQFFFVVVLMNYLLLSLTVPPVSRYIFPTEFFLYFYPVSLLFWINGRFKQ